MKHRKILFIGAIALVVGFNFGLRSNVPEASAAVCILKNITWMQANAKNGDWVKFKIDGQDCALDAVKVRVMLYQPILTESEITEINLNFPRSGNQILGDWQVTISSVALANSKLYLIANLNSAGTGTQLDSKGASIPYLTVAPPLSLNPDVTITAFDITPKKINANQTTELNATFRAKATTPAYFATNCSQVQAFLLDDSNREIYTQSAQTVSATNPDYKFDFRYRYDAKGDGVVNLKGKLKCLFFGAERGSATLPISAPVCIAIGSGVCSGTGGAVCGNNRCESGETQVSCPADCRPGETQTYGFEILNPLKGGADDFAGLVKILAQWIFNLAIPIAVVMIVYSGILFLTAAGEPAKVTKARDVLKWAVVGLAIILIGSGFVTLIKSILELGGENSPPPIGQKYSCNSDSCEIDSNGPFTEPTCNNSCGTAIVVGAVGNKCARDRDCVVGLECEDTICQRATGNLVNEPCNSGSNCDTGLGLRCDKSGAAIQIIDGQTLGSCYESGNLSGYRLGDSCAMDSDCMSGLECNQICQRKDGNLNGEACVKTADNCKSNACSTTGSNLVGVCVANPSI